MTSNIIKNSSLTTSSTDFSLTAIESRLIQANTVTYDFIVTVTSGCLSGRQFEGFFTFNNSLITGVGSEEISVKEGLSLSFEFLDVIYTEVNDFDSPLYPRVLFEAGQLAGLDFEAFNNGISYQIIRDFGNRSSFFSYLLKDGEATAAGSGNVTYFLRKDSAISISTPNTVEELNVLSLNEFLRENRDIAL